MVSTVTAPLFQGNVSELWKPQQKISVRALPPPRTLARQYRLSSRQLRKEARYESLKRYFDVLAAAVALVFLAPSFVAIAAAIKLTSPGPVFFRQRRYGYRNRLFCIYKFRTMHVRLGDTSGVRQTTRDDARVTPVGRLLRHTSLDEIPQLINVLKGEMSLVGPRPHVPGMLAAELRYEDLVPNYFQRHSARPGITGLAQVSGCRGSTRDASLSVARINHDLDYIERRSLTMDFRIIARTLMREFISGNGT